MTRTVSATTQRRTETLRQRHSTLTQQMLPYHPNPPSCHPAAPPALRELEDGRSLHPAAGTHHARTVAHPGPGASLLLKLSEQ
eukprot:754789-Hanusia_phi.AAC.4